MNPIAAAAQRLVTLLESILSSADDPEERIRLLVADLRRRQTEGRRALGLSLSLELHLLADLCAAEDESAAWERTAKVALAASGAPAPAAAIQSISGTSAAPPTSAISSLAAATPTTTPSDTSNTAAATATAEEAATRLLSARAREQERRARYEEQRDAAAKVRAAVVETARRTQEVAHAKSVLLARARCADALSSITETLELLRSPQVVRALGEAELAAERKEAAAVTPGVGSSG